MRSLLTCAGLALAAGALVVAQEAAVGPVERLDAALDASVPQHVKVEILKEDYFGSSEGPVWVPEGTSGGHLLFSDQGANRIYKWSSPGGLSVFMENAGYTGDPAKWTESCGAQYIYNNRLFLGLIGTNGLTRDREGRLVMANRGDCSLVRIEKNGVRTTLTDRYQGKRYMAPNDLVVRSDGSVYFSAPFPARADAAPPGLYRWSPDGSVQLLDVGSLPGGTLNGMAFSPDEKALYVIAAASSVNRSGGGNPGGKIWRFEVKADGTIANGVPLVTDAGAGADGMKVDRQGNMYFNGVGGLWIVDPTGKHLGTVRMGRFTNLAFGDPDRKGLYITIQRGLARVRLNIPGI